jgi:Xaa-Pro aminopeptidase
MRGTRVQRVLRILKEERTDGLLITDMATIRYLSGFTGSEASVLITTEAFFILVDSRYTSQAKQEAPFFATTKIVKRSEDTARLIRRLKLGRVGFDAATVSVSLYKELEEQLKGVELLAVKESFATLRVRKDRSELGLIRQAIGIATAGFRQILPLLHTGTTEKEIAAELEIAHKRAGADKLSFDTIVASGKRSALPHGVASSKKIGPGEFVTIDFGIQYQGYCTDETCTVVNGKPTQKQREVFAVVKAAHDRAIEKIKPGVSCKKVDAAARDYIAKKGFAKHFGHGTGHGVGLSVHEEPRVSPLSEGALEEGMVITVEPGIYLPDWGGVRLEDMVLVTRGGCEVLTSLEKTLRIALS